MRRMTGPVSDEGLRAGALPSAEIRRLGSHARRVSALRAGPAGRDRSTDGSGARQGTGPVCSRSCLVRHAWIDVEVVDVESARFAAGDQRDPHWLPAFGLLFGLEVDRVGHGPRRVAAVYLAGVLRSAPGLRSSVGNEELDALSSGDVPH